jgi:hypothetical protein
MIVTPSSFPTFGKPRMAPQTDVYPWVCFFNLLSLRTPQKTLPQEPGTVAQVYNPNYLEGGDWEDHGSSAAWAKNSQDPTSTND